MAKKGKAGIALFITTIASLFGAMFGLALLILFSPTIAEVGLKFGPAELFAMMVMGLVAASSMGSGSPVKGLAMMVMGVLLGMVGTDVNSGAARYTMDVPELMDGINLVALAMGLFGVSEVVRGIHGQDDSKKVEKVTLRSMIPAKQEMNRGYPAMFRGSVIGSALGALPGVGPSIAAFMAYAVEKRSPSVPKSLGMAPYRAFLHQSRPITPLRRLPLCLRCRWAFRAMLSWPSCWAH